MAAEMSRAPRGDFAGYFIHLLLLFTGRLKGLIVNRPKPHDAATQYGFLQRQSAPPLSIDEIDHDQRVVHHDTCQGNDAECGKEGQVDPHDDMSDDGAYHAKGNCRHDDQRLDVATEFHTEKYEDHNEGNGGIDGKALQRFLLFPLFTLETVA